MLNGLIKNRFFKPVLVLGAGVLITTMSVNSYAGGFQLFESSVKSMGNAFSGTSAVAQDASTEFYNPAGLTRLKHAQISFTGTLIDIYTKGTASATHTQTPLGFGPVPVTGRSDLRPGGLAVVPSFHVAVPINKRIAVGFGVNSPFGLETDYEDNTVVRFLATKSSLLVASIGPSVAFQITPKFSIGGGIGAEYADAKLDQMAPTLYTPGLKQEAKFSNEADGWAFVWDVGALYQFTPNTRVGVSYHSEADHHLKGNASIKGNFALTPGGKVNGKGKVRTDLTLPDSANLSVFHQIDQQFAVMAGLTWTDWSELNSVTLNYSGPISQPSQPISLTSVTIPLKFRDTYRVSIGGDFMPNEHWTFRTGLAWDQSPVRGTSSRTFRLPDSNRFWIAFGATYKFNKNWSADFGYTHLFINNADIRRTQNTSALINGHIPVNLTEQATGSFSSSVNQYGIEVDYKFA